MFVPDLPYEAIFLTDFWFLVKNFNGFPILKHINYNVFLVLPVLTENLLTMILGNWILNFFPFLEQRQETTLKESLGAHELT